MKKLVSWLKRLSLENKLAFTGIVVTVAIAMVGATWAVVTRIIDKNLPVQTTLLASEFNELPQPVYQNLSFCRGLVADENRQYRKAAKHYEQAAKEYELYGYDRAVALNRAGKAYFNVKRYNKAKNCFLEAQAIYIADSQENEEELAQIYNNLGTINYYQGDYNKGLDYYKKAVQMRETILGEDDPQTASTMKNLAVCYGAMGSYDESFSFYLKAYRVFLSKLGDDHPDTKNCLENLQGTYKASALSQSFDDWLAAQLAE